jgi:redox-sensitive bicupin YhaK (pirin superfamily)
MKAIRLAQERGHADHGWLKTYHTFSFAEYRDPKHIHFRALRVMNEDWIAPGQGFGEHPHHDMEIVTYVLEGQLAHRDSMGHVEVLRAGEFQRMSAGTGITHSEFNASPTEPVHLYQIWLFPSQKAVEPSYEQRLFPESERRGEWQLVAAPGGTDGALTIQQDARVYLANLAGGQSLERSIQLGRHTWLQVLRGDIVMDDQLLNAGDGVAISDEQSLNLSSGEGAEVMLFDLA